MSADSDATRGRRAPPRSSLATVLSKLLRERRRNLETTLRAAEDFIERRLSDEQDSERRRELLDILAETRVKHAQRMALLTVMETVTLVVLRVCMAVAIGTGTVGVARGVGLL
jgi:hypothetical protein